MLEKPGEHQEQVFPTFNIQAQEELQRRLFQLLEDEIVKNPDIQRIGRDIFGSENKFFAWYLSPHNAGTEDGIPEGVTKISILQNIQSLPKYILIQGTEAFGTKEKFYRGLLKYSEFNHYGYKYKTIPLYFPHDALINYIERIERGDFGVA